MAEAERKVVEVQTKKAADVLKQEVAAYGGESNYVRARLYEKTAPQLRDVVTADAPGEIFGLPIRERETGNGRPQPSPPNAKLMKGGAK